MFQVLQYKVQKISPQASPEKIEPQIETNLNITIIPEVNETQNTHKEILLKVEQQNKFKDTFLYQIMTDPQFIENLQKNKQKKKPSCQFCKKEFETEADVKDHLNVRVDESKRV